MLEVGGDEAETLLSYGVIDQLQPGAITDPGTDPMAVGARLVDLLDRLQSDSEVVVLVIDDLQWVDRPSSRAVLFALRRLRADKVLTIVSSRVDQLVDPGWARFIAGDARVTRIRLGGLNAQDLIDLASALGLGTLSKRAAARLAAHTEGNALYCRALLDEIGIAGLNGEDSALPAPRELSAVILARVAGLSAAAQAFLAAASVLGHHASASTIASVAQLPDAQEAIDAAVAAGLLSESALASELTFTHPLYRAAIYADLSPTSRRALHARAAEFVAGRAGLDPSRRSVARSRRGIGPRVRGVRSSQCRARRLGRFGLGLRAGGFPFAGCCGPRASAARCRGGPTQRRRHVGGGTSPGFLRGVQCSLRRADGTSRRLHRFARRPRVACSPRGRRMIQKASVRLAPAPRRRWPTGWSSRVDPIKAIEWGGRAVDGTVADSAVRAMARTAQAYGFAAAGRSPEGLAVLDFLPDSGNEVPVSATDALIMRGMLKLYVDDLSGSIADLGIAAARLRNGLPTTYPGPVSVPSERRPLSAGRLGRRHNQCPVGNRMGARCRPSARPGAGPRTGRPRSWPFAVSGLPPRTHVSAARAAAQRFPQVLPVANAAMAAVSARLGSW